jgi:hypothetical protein
MPENSREGMPENSPEGLPEISRGREPPELRWTAHAPAGAAEISSVVDLFAA